MQLCDEAPHLVDLQFSERCITGQLEQRAHIMRVTADGMRAQAPFVRQMRQELREQLFGSTV